MIPLTVKCDYAIWDQNLAAPQPVYASQGAAAFDVQAITERNVRIDAGEVAVIGTNLCVAVPQGYCLKAYPRSGLGLNGMILANTVGVIDSDYRGEILIALWNRTCDSVFTVKPGDRIAQLCLEPAIQAAFNLVEELPPTERGHGGFGSTGE